MANVLGLVTFKVFPPQMGGQKGVGLFYKHLSKYTNCTLAITKADDQPSALSYGIKSDAILYNNKNILSNLWCLNKIQSIIKDNSIGILISEHSYPAFLAVFIKRKTGLPIIIHSHNIESLRFKQMSRWWWILYKTYEGWVHRQADYNFFISNDDMEFAINRFQLDTKKCAVITYGIEQNTIPSVTEKQELKKKLQLETEDYHLLFNGTLDYIPNIEAINTIIQKINPLLLKHIKNYKIVITGNRASKDLIHLLNAQSNIVFRGFVENIDDYYQSADLFLNPICNDSGVKTKVIEAIANNCTVISYTGGAQGIPTNICNEKLITVQNDDFEAFCQQILNHLQKDQPATPSSFYDYYNWDNIAQKASRIIQQVIDKDV